MTARLVKAIYRQDGDSCGGEDDQEIALELMDAGAGEFLVIVTERWAIDLAEIDGFAQMLKDMAAHAVRS